MPARDLPGVPWLRLHASDARGTCSIPDQGTKIPHAAKCGALSPQWPLKILCFVISSHPKVKFLPFDKFEQQVFTESLLHTSCLEIKLWLLGKLTLFSISPWISPVTSNHSKPYLLSFFTISRFLLMKTFNESHRRFIKILLQQNRMWLCLYWCVCPCTHPDKYICIVGLVQEDNSPQRSCWFVEC